MSAATIAAVGATHTILSECSTRMRCQPSLGSPDAARIENWACAGVTRAKRNTVRHTIHVAGYSIHTMSPLFTVQPIADSVQRKSSDKHLGARLFGVGAECWWT